MAKSSKTNPLGPGMCNVSVNCSIELRSKLRALATAKHQTLSKYCGEILTQFADGLLDIQTETRIVAGPRPVSLPAEAASNDVPVQDLTKFSEPLKKVRERLDKTPPPIIPKSSLPKKKSD